MHKYKLKKHTRAIKTSTTLLEHSRKQILSESVVENHFNKGNIVKAIMMPSSNAGYDFITTDNEKIEVKTISRSDNESKSGTLMVLAYGKRNTINRICDYFYGYNEHTNTLYKVKNKRNQKKIRLANNTDKAEEIKVDCNNLFSNESVIDIYNRFYKLKSHSIVTEIESRSKIEKDKKKNVERCKRAEIKKKNGGKRKTKKLNDVATKTHTKYFELKRNKYKKKQYKTERRKLQVLQAKPWDIQFMEPTNLLFYYKAIKQDKQILKVIVKIFKKRIKNYFKREI